MLAFALPVFLGATVALASVVNVFERSDPSPNRCSTVISDDEIDQAEKDFMASQARRSLEEAKSRICGNSGVLPCHQCRWDA